MRFSKRARNYIYNTMCTTPYIVVVRVVNDENMHEF
jgi:hypothetical protein